MHIDEQTRAIKTHFKLSNLSFSLLREQQFFLPTAGMMWGGEQGGVWPLPDGASSCPLLSCPVLSSPAATHYPREHRLCQRFAEPTGVCVVGGESREAPSLLTPLSTGSAFSTP